MYEQIFKYSIKDLESILVKQNSKKIMVIAGQTLRQSIMVKEIEKINVSCVIFSGFTPNPLYEQVYQAIKIFNKEQCDTIVSIGGGSAIDLAKCIKLYCKSDLSHNLLVQECRDTKIPLIAIPTTAGTGSESTKYAVIYYKGEKQSISHNSIIPDYVLLDATTLKSLPPFQKKCAMLDALCQAIESWWSVNSTITSRKYSEEAIKIIVKNYKDYVETKEKFILEEMLLASNYAGRAINITATTAPHAMSYKLTSLYNIPHGYAVALCLPKVWKYMVENSQNCIDVRGRRYLEEVFDEISTLISVEKFNNIVDSLNMQDYQWECDRFNIEQLSNSVNHIRMKNNPIKLEDSKIREIYSQIEMEICN